MSLIALATDFGDGLYVGEMKAVILCRAPRARVVDLFHSVSPQSVLEGAFLLSKSWGFFPEKTIFVAVIDPGVGSARRILAVRAMNRTFLAPDNGLLSFLPQTSIDEIRSVENKKYFLPDVSSTFHGRDIFSPVAAALSLGTSVSNLGPRAAGMVRLADLAPRRSGNRIEGKIVHIDRFGNAVTNLPASNSSPVVRIGGKTIRAVARTYAEAPAGRPVLVRSSFSTWEIAESRGSAAARLNLRVGQPLRQEFQNPDSAKPAEARA